jgi:hypothetical protein
MFFGPRAVVCLDCLLIHERSNQKGRNGMFHPRPRTCESLESNKEIVGYDTHPQDITETSRPKGIFYFFEFLYLF